MNVEALVVAREVADVLRTALDAASSMDSVNGTLAAYDLLREEVAALAGELEEAQHA